MITLIIAKTFKGALIPTLHMQCDWFSN